VLAPSHPGKYRTQKTQQTADETYILLSCRHSYIAAGDTPDTCDASTCPSHNFLRTCTHSEHSALCCDGRILHDKQITITITI